jgi:hypothetical protein
LWISMLVTLLQRKEQAAYRFASASITFSGPSIGIKAGLVTR